MQHIYCAVGLCFWLLGTSRDLFCLGIFKNFLMVAFRLLHLQAVMSRPFCFLVTVDYAASEVMFQCPTPVPSLVLHSDLSLMCWLTSVIITMAGPAAQCAVSYIALTAAEAHFILLHRTKCPLSLPSHVLCLMTAAC
jgi:hypothetical protein